MKTNIKIINVPTLLEYAQINSYDNKIKYIASLKNKIDNDLDTKFNLYLRYGIKGLFDKQKN